LSEIAYQVSAAIEPRPYEAVANPRWSPFAAEEKFVEFPRKIVAVKSDVRECLVVHLKETGVMTEEKIAAREPLAESCERSQELPQLGGVPWRRAA
jgi:hypothetical protein